MAKLAEIGTPAPDFTLPGLLLGSDGTVTRADYTLSAAKGRPLVLAFYPGDQSKVCTAQLCSYQSELAEFTEMGAEVWGISPQDLESHEKFALKERLEFPLLADPGLVSAKAFGITAPVLGLRRAVFVIDAEGIIRWKHVAVVGATFQSASVIREQIVALAA
ncbi:peroxiredoxin [Subtercola endophyticus]|uniref:peroxiredoxin n=1 Tax=Subtercola endophyticus TaxID=2895559 RepID=UPI001E61C612|nr:peroxiredoxin [Subtercola endophyticus]UFS59730.1 peroxiredoxin [Subtercola endophyticus]